MGDARPRPHLQGDDPGARTHRRSRAGCAGAGQGPDDALGDDRAPRHGDGRARRRGTVFHEPTTGASSDIDQATKIARAMVTEYGMSSKLGAVRYGQEQGDPFLGRSMGGESGYPTRWPRRSTRRCATSSRPPTTRRGPSSPSTATPRRARQRAAGEETLTRKDLEQIFDGVISATASPISMTSVGARPATSRR